MKRTKKQKTAMLIAVILAAMIILPMLISALIPAADAATISQKDIDKRKEDQKAIQDIKKGLQSKLKQLKNEKADVLEIKSAIDEQISVIELEIESSNALIQDLNVRLAQQQEALTKAIADEKEAAELFRVRLRVMEEAGDISYLSILFQSGSFSEMLGNIDIINEVMDADRRVIEKLARSRADIENIQALLEQDKADQLAASQALIASQGELAAQYEEIDALIAGLNEDHAELSKQVEAAEAEERAVADDVAKLQAERAKQLEEERKKNEYVGGEYLFPVPGYTIGPDKGHKFGMRMHPLLKINRPHNGVDIPAPTGTKVVAANTGVVLISQKSSSYGNYIVIDHGGGRATLYAHLSKRSVNKGDSVKRGDKIGEVGSTGLSTGPHLHFECQENGEYKNPINYLVKQ